MIIIKLGKILQDIEYKIISTILFNMEMGENAFNMDGSLGDIDKDFHVLYDDGITYNIRGIIGNIIMLCGENNNQKYIKDLITKLGDFLSELEFTYMNNRGVWKHTNQSTDYTLVSYKCDTPNTVNTRLITDKLSLLTKKYKYVWRLLKPVDAVQLLSDFDLVVSRNVNEFEHLLRHNTLIIDTCDVFGTKENITFVNDTPNIGCYTMSNRFVSQDVIIYDTNNGSIDDTLRKFANVYCTYNLREYFDIFYLVYEEQWENINPIRVVHRNNPHTLPYEDEIKRICDILCSAHDHIHAELEELKKTGTSILPNRNDICTVCEMYLYDLIYVLERDTNHVCVCNRCYHDNIYKLMSYDHIDINVLKVKYPRTVVDVINMIDTPDGVRSLLIELTGDNVVVENNSISTPNYIGYDNKHDVLLRYITPPSDKTIFICDFKI